MLQYPGCFISRGARRFRSRRARIALQTVFEGQPVLGLGRVVKTLIPEVLSRLLPRLTCFAWQVRDRGPPVYPRACNTGVNEPRRIEAMPHPSALY